MIEVPKKIYIDKSSIHGIGVFANDFIPENEIIEICPVIDMGMNFGELSHILLNYRFNWPQGSVNFEKQVVCVGYGMLYNHSNTPNAAWRSNIELNSFEFFAIKPIEKGQEIFVWYGNEDYWNDGRSNIEIK
jgi:SET domain-containing protein